jgi:deazaflavin-dependent oxidoreductase (nitroreductase family)
MSGSSCQQQPSAPPDSVAASRSAIRAMGPAGPCQLGRLLRMADRGSNVSRGGRVLTPLIASRPGSWFYLNVANKVDKRLLPATDGRVSLSLGQPVLCLETTGARTGLPRRTPLLFLADGADLVVIASATGRPRHPAWYHNLLANSGVKVWAPRGRTGLYVARTAIRAERERLWDRAVELYAGFDVYVGRVAGEREIPVVVLTRSALEPAPA